MNQRLWCWTTAVVFTGTLALSINVSAFQQPVPQVFNLDGTAGPPDRSVKAIPLSMPKTTLLSIQSPSRSLTAGGVNGAEAVIYQNENFSGFVIFRNFNPTTGLAFPGTLIADNMGLGSGFSPGGRLSSYDLTVFRSNLDPQPGLADFHVELWDGDPFCSVDTPGGGFSCMPIAGTEADFIGLPANFVTTLRAVLPGKPIAPNTAVWMALSTSETANPAPCRLGWIISSLLPTIGNDEDLDVWEDQRDSDSETNGGTCCIDGLACGGADPPCAFCGSTGTRCTDDPDCPAGDTCFGGATDGDRGFCSDGDAEDANLFFFGGPCTGDRNTDNCATFMASVFAPADVSVTLQPVGNGPLGRLDPGASIVGNEIIMLQGSSTVLLEIRISDFDVIDVFCVGGTNDGTACTSDADCPDVKQCNLASTNAGAPCASNADCPGPVGSACEITDPGSCGNKLSAYQSTILSDGFTSGLEGTLSRIVIPCTSDADCVTALGGVCNLVPSTACTADADCPPIGPFTQTCQNGGPSGAHCDTASGLCIPGFISETRPDYIMAAASGTFSAVNVSVPQFTRIAAAVQGAAVDELDPFPPGGAYAGSLALDVTANARGTFTIDIAGVPDSALVNHRNLFIPLVGFVPGKVTVRIPQCGDGFIDAGEQCDDGNTISGDGCSSTCTIEPGFVCTGEPSVCSPDCNGNSVPDDQDIAAGTSLDCNGNAVPDECDIVDGTSQDCNGNAVPDECEVATNDCNLNAIPDECDITGGFSSDCNSNTVPDECDIATGTSQDCNGNGVPDSCDIATCAAGDVTCDDCNLNGAPDLCDVPPPAGICAVNCSADANADGVPDECVVPSGAGGTNNWSDGTNWNLGGNFPDNTAGVANLSVTLAPTDNLLVDVDIQIDTLRILNGASLNVTQETAADLSVVQAGGLLDTGTLLVANDRIVDASVGMVTLGSGGIYQADPMSAGTGCDPGVGVCAVLQAGDVTILAGEAGCIPAGTMRLEEAMRVETGGDFVLDGRGVNPFVCPPPPTQSPASFLGGRTPPILVLRASALLLLSGNLNVKHVADICVGCDGAGGPSLPGVRLGGDFINTSVFPSLFDWINGELIFDGVAPQTFEVAGIDLGATLEGFNTDADALFDTNPHKNFAIGTVEVAAGRDVTFVNREVNTVGTGDCTVTPLEALYVHDLTLRSGSTVRLDNARVYVVNLTKEAGVTVTTLGCGSLCPILQPPTSDGVPKNRYLSLIGGNAGVRAAMRVTFQNLPGTFAALDGQTMWVGSPQDVSEAGGLNDATPPTFKNATLQCNPFFMDWSTVGVVDVSHWTIIPDGVYAIQIVGEGCSLANEGSFTPALTLTQTPWGDTVGPFDPITGTWMTPDGSVDVTVDILAGLGKFSGSPGAPIKARVDLEPATPDRLINITDVTRGLDAFRGFSFPFAPQAFPCP